MEQDSEQKNSGGLKVGLIVFIILVVVLVILAVTKLGGKETETLGTENTSGLQMEKQDDSIMVGDVVLEDNAKMDGDSSMSQDKENGSATDSDAMVGEVKTFQVEGKSFAFTPNEIKVKKGDTVKIVFKNVQGFHDLVIDEFNVKTKQIQAGETEEVTFTADKTGTFEFYCSVGSHRQMGMVGKLVVE